MHYCLMLITKEFPSKAVVEKALEYYNSEKFYEEKGENEDIPYPIITWDWWQIGGRYNGSLKLKVDNENEKYRWQYYFNGGRNKQLFYSMLLSDMENYARNSRPNFFTEEDYYRTMGYKDGYLRVDGAFVDDLINFDEVECFCCIDKNGKAYTREYYDRGKFIKNDKFDEQLKQIKANSKGCYATIIDIHD